MTAFTLPENHQNVRLKTRDKRCSVKNPLSVGPDEVTWPYLWSQSHAYIYFTHSESPPTSVSFKTHEDYTYRCTIKQGKQVCQNFYMSSLFILIFANWTDSLWTEVHGGGLIESSHYCSYLNGWRRYRLGLTGLRVNMAMLEKSPLSVKSDLLYLRWSQVVKEQQARLSPSKEDSPVFNKHTSVFRKKSAEVVSVLWNTPGITALHANT